MAWAKPAPVAPEVVFQDEITQSAIKNACGMALDVEDARIILDMLGLVPDPARFPSWDVDVRGVKRAPSTVPAAPLPSSGYGAVLPDTPA